MPWGQSDGANVRQQSKLWDIQREKKKKERGTFLQIALRHNLARSQNRGLSEYQRRAGQPWTGPSPRWRQRDREAAARAGGQEASSTKLWAGSQLLTRSPWNHGWLTSARRFTVKRSAPQRRHTANLRWHSGGAPRKPSHWDWGGDKMHRTPGRVRSQSTWSLELLGPGKGAKHRPNLCLCGVPENLNLSGLDPGSACNPGLALDTSPAEQPGAWAV